ncbi:MAG: hypothetical protein BWK78_06645, partial [Thiotrichaceae bacterium IS1]
QIIADQLPQIQPFDLNTWWESHRLLSPLHHLATFLEEILLARIPQQRIVIFIDESDAILQFAEKGNFFSLIRTCHNLRSEKPIYNRLTFAILGVASPADLIADKKLTPFNIGRAIDLVGFQPEEVKPLEEGLRAITVQPAVVLARVLYWTGGQPFLTQKICYLLLQEEEITVGEEIAKVDQVVQSEVLDHWEVHDEPTHLRPIRDRLFREGGQHTGQLLELYQTILLAPLEEGIIANDSRIQLDLRLSGLVVKTGQGRLRVYNPIYAQVFNQTWVITTLANLRPYAEALNAWVASNFKDESRLLRGQALQVAQAWVKGKKLGDDDHQFLNASQLFAQKTIARQRMTWLLAVFLAIALGLGGLTGWQWWEAQQKREKLAQTLEEVKKRRQEADEQRLEAQRQAEESQRKGEELARALEEAKKRKQEADEQRLEAQRQARESEKNRQQAQQQATLAKLEMQTVVAGLSPGLVNGYLDQALLLAVQAYHLVPNRETQGNLLRVLQSMDGRLKYFLRKHQKSVRSVVFSPDGQILASGSSDSSIILWDMQTNQQLGPPLLGHREAVNSVAFSPNGQWLASGSDDNSVILWNMKPPPHLVQRWQEHTRSVETVAFGPDNQILASGGYDNNVILWDVNAKKRLAPPLQGHSKAVRSIAFSPDGQRLASGGEDTDVILWDVKTYQRLKPKLKGHSKTVTSVVFNPSDGRLVSVAGNSGIILWNMKNYQPLQPPEWQNYSGWVNSLAFSSDGKILVGGSGNNNVILWQTEPLKFEQFWPGHSTSIGSIAVSPKDPQKLAAGTTDGSIILLDMQASKKVISETLPEGHNDKVNTVAFSNDGDILASGSGSQGGNGDNSIVLWDVMNRKPLGPPLRGQHSDQVKSVAFNPKNSQELASGSADKSVILWDLKNFKDPQPLEPPLLGHSGGVLSVAFSPDGQWLASGGEYGDIFLWDLHNRPPRGQPLRKHSGWVQNVTFSPDGLQLVSGGSDRNILLWDMQTKQFVESLSLEHDGEVKSLAFQANGQLLASGSGDTNILLWGLNTRKRFGSPLRGHYSGVTSVAFNPQDEQMLASGSYGSDILLWDVQTQTPIGQSLYGHQDSVNSVAFRSDGKLLASGSADKTVRLWDVDPQSWVKKACEIANRNFTEKEWRRFLGEERKYEKTCPQFEVQVDTE